MWSSSKRVYVCVYVEYVSVSVRVFVLLFICALCPNPELLQPPLLPTAALPPPLSARLLVVAATTCCCLLLLLRLLLSAIIVYVCVRMCAIRYGSTFWFLLLSSFIASLARSLALSSGPTTKCSLNYATTVFRRRVHEWRWCVCTSDCLLVGTGADRKITTADQPRCLHFSNCPTLTHTLFCAPSLLCLCFGKIFDKKTIVNDTAVLGSLASHAHYHGTAAVLAAVFVCTCSSACACVCVLLPNSM